MVEYKRCSDVNISEIYKAFRTGFSDYMVKLELSEENFIRRFFGPEGNNPAISFIALDGGNPVGLILGGMKIYEGIKTMRCGTLCIAPEYRGKGISGKLFELHKEEALRNNCRQLFLEVIAGNDRAIKFYNKVGYEQVYQIKYFSMANLDRLQEYKNKDYVIRKIEHNVFEEAALKSSDIHVNWQNDLDYIKRSDGQIFYGAFKGEKTTAVICINPSGKISYLWTLPEYRMEGAAIALIKTAVSDLGIKKLSASFASNALLEGFYRHIGFTKDPIAQYEMYLTL